MQIALTIAGSDSGGGAGIQGDLKTFQRFGVFGTTAITAITAQNSLGVADWRVVALELIRAQIDSVAADLRPSAVKTGMLGTGEVVRTVARAIIDHRLAPYVLDPVMIATSGDPLIDDDAAASIKNELIPLAAIITPNADEATVLTGIVIRGEDDMRTAALMIEQLGAKAVLIKGGHVDQHRGEEVVDCFYDGAYTFFRHPRIATTSTHGTGCAVSAAITALLARGTPLGDAVSMAIDYVQLAIETAPGLGGGNGPLNHLAGSPVTNSRTIP